MKSFIIAVNFKTYAQATGDNAVSLVKDCSQITTETGIPVIACVQAPDIARCCESGVIPIFSQHVDAIEAGAHTGQILASDVRQNGASGTLLNHSEDPYQFEDLKKAVALCKAQQLVIIICAKTVEEAAKLTSLKPDYIAYEPPELIGGDVSVTTRPQSIKDVVAAIHAVDSTMRVLVGAGVKSAQDVTVAQELGCQGVLLASGVTKSDHPKVVLKELCAAVTRP
ncbi:MAG: triosephosphate isomerase [Candidatus Woesearchaeota archaeon]|jgi:triosephosphate isomerase